MKTQRFIAIAAAVAILAGAVQAKTLSISAGFGRGQSSGIGRGHSSGISLGHSSGISRGHSSGIGRGHSSGIGRGQSSSIGRGHSMGYSRGHGISRPVGSSSYGRPVVSSGCGQSVVRSHTIVRPSYKSSLFGSLLRSAILSIRPLREVVTVIRPSVSTVVVAPPRTRIVTSQTVVAEPSVITVWVENSNGSRSPVELTRSGPGYIGPRGEYYTEMPNNEQLRMVYGF